MNGMNGMNGGNGGNGRMAERMAEWQNGRSGYIRTIYGTRQRQRQRRRHSNLLYYRWLGRIKHSTLSKFWWPILELEYNRTPKKWRQAQMQATKKLPSKCKHQDRAKGLCRKMPWNCAIDFDLECLNYHNRVFSNDKGVVCQWQSKSLGKKKVAERFIISHQHKKVRL